MNTFLLAIKGKYKLWVVKQDFTFFSMGVPNLKEHVKGVKPSLKSITLYGIEEITIKLN